MKQIELLPKRAKVKFCDFILLHPPRLCRAKATITIKDGAYCAKHAEQAQKYFGQGKPIVA